MAKGIASIGAVEAGATLGEAGVGVARGEAAVGVLGMGATRGVVAEVGGAEGPALFAVLPRVKSPVSLARFSWVITMAAPERNI